MAEEQIAVSLKQPKEEPCRPSLEHKLYAALNPISAMISLFLPTRSVEWSAIQDMSNMVGCDVVEESMNQAAGLLRHIKTKLFSVKAVCHFAAFLGLLHHLQEQSLLAVVSLLSKTKSLCFTRI